MSFLPLSIPSPPEDWRSIDFGRWLASTFGWEFAESWRIATYALLILVGIVLATAWVNSRLKARGAEPGVVLDVIIFAVPLGLVGARAYHVLTHLGDYFYEGSNPWNPLQPGSVWAIWEGGNAIIGSLIGGAIGAYIGCRVTGLRFWTFADALAPAILLAQVIGRLGNYVNHELFGLPTDLPWGLEIPSPNPAIPVGLPEGTLFHPTFLYEMIWNTVGIVFLLTMERQFRLQRRRIAGLSIVVPVGDAQPRLQWGKVWALYLVWYGVGRVIFESIRIDPSEVFFGIRANVWGAFALIVIGVVLYLVQRRRHPGLEPSPYVPGREWVPGGAVDSDETYSDSDDPSDEAATEPELAATSGSQTPTS
ncbi:prolipoprotein diacylglyceryl transferase [Antiquaquibacter oligotrophicus]|uniref:prolipoprotein diacylglyceryl transferase n=1 Tax=Antiquaquibacter oligotrophicus TaxID=2880260 RepID=UPI0038993030